MGDTGAAGCLEALVLGLGGIADAPGGAEELDVLRCFGPKKGGEGAQGGARGTPGRAATGYDNSISVLHGGGQGVGWRQ